MKFSVPVTTPVVRAGTPTVGVPATGTRPKPFSMLRNTPQNSARNGLAGATGVFTPNREKNPASRLTNGFTTGTAAAAAVTGVVTAAAAATGAAVLVLATVDAGPALLPIDPVGPAGPVLVTTAAAVIPAPWPVAAAAPKVLSVPECVLLATSAAVDLELLMVAAPVEPVAVVPGVVDPVLPATTTAAAGPGLPVLAGVEGLVGLAVEVPLVVLAAVAVVGALPLVDGVLAADV